VPAATTAANLAGAAEAGLLCGNGDDPAPQHLGTSTYIGANHGHAYHRLVTTASAHGLTVEDIGSVWQDAAGTPIRWVLLEIPSATTVRFGRESVTVNTDGSWTYPSSAAITGSLTHVSGALHTTTITPSIEALAGDLFPAVRQKTLRITADGAAVASTGTYTAEELTVLDEYEIMSYPSLITYLKARAGSSSAVNYIDPTVQALMTVKLTYRCKGGETRVRAALTIEATPVRMSGSGIVQAGVLTLTGSQRLIQYVPDTLPIGGLDHSLGVDITSITPPATYFTSAYWKYATAGPPTRMKQAVTQADGTPVYALEVGYSETKGAGRPAIRNTALEGGPALYLASSKKQYPQLFGNYTAPTVATPAGAVLEGEAYRRYTHS